MIIEVQIDARCPIEGSARGDDEAIYAFAGWLELLSALSALLEAKPAEGER